MKIELDWLRKWKMYSPKAIALQDGDTGRSLTYEQLFSESCKMAEVLHSKFEVRQGDRITCLSVNELEVLVLFFAAARLGASLVPINYRLTLREVDYLVKDSSPKLFVYHPEYSTIAEQLSSLVQRVALVGDGSLQTLIAQETHLYTDFQAEESTTALIIYTSGTTGAPKGAMLSHAMLFWNSINTSLRLNIVQSDSAVIFLPLFHTGGWNVLTTPFLHRGAKIVLIKKFEPDLVLSLVEKSQSTLLFGVPTTMQMMSQTENFKKTSFAKIRYAIVGGEPMPLEAIRLWHDRGVSIRQGYGLTEFGPNVFSLNEEDAIRKMGSIGFPNFYIEVKILTATGEIAKPGEVGELLLRGPMCMTGYWHNSKATEETIQDGWLATGDLVRFDDEGFFYVVGRKKEMYKSGGENVYPAEIEKTIYELPQILEAAVIGVPDEKWGEVGKAFVVLKPGQSMNDFEIQEHCRRNLAKFKVPKYIQFLSSLPKGDSGKILKRQLVSI